MLLTGGSGTGKEVLARYIHRHGPGRQQPFLAVNCSALAESLLESQLFGVVKGAYTGAEKSREGLFAAAAGGTILLDEIGDISPNLQQKLLRVIETKEIKFRPKIDEHDYQTKKRHVVRFLDAGAKVKVTIMFRGREMAHAERGLVILERLAKEVEDLAIIESPPKLEGRNMLMMLGPVKKKEKSDSSAAKDDSVAEEPAAEE